MDFDLVVAVDNPANRAGQAVEAADDLGRGLGRDLAVGAAEAMTKPRSSLKPVRSTVGITSPQEATARGYTAGADVRVHAWKIESARGLQAPYGNGWRAGGHISDPFVVDCVRPAPFDKAINSGLYNDVPEMERIEDAGVENRDRGLKRHSAA